jgi:hypothetical protein
MIRTFAQSEMISDKEQTLLDTSMQVQTSAKPYAGMHNTSQPFQANYIWTLWVSWAIFFPLCERLDNYCLKRRGVEVMYDSKGVGKVG